MHCSIAYKNTVQVLEFDLVDKKKAVKLIHFDSAFDVSMNSPLITGQNRTSEDNDTIMHHQHTTA
jgi:hypothetical protein